MLLDAVFSIGLFSIVAMWFGLWVFEKDPTDPYDDPDNWGDQ